MGSGAVMTGPVWGGPRWLLHLDKLPKLGLVGRLTGATAGEEEEDFGQLPWNCRENMLMR
jgi:hypothetical protein